MDSLIITQSNAETVTSNLITKLYQEVSNSISYNITGILSVNKCYESEAEYLRTHCPELTIISSGGYYINIEDPIVKSLLANQIGDGIGVTATDINNTTINTIANINFDGAERFHEFSRFTQIQNISSGSNIDLKTINKVSLPCNTLVNNSITFPNSVYELICPYLTDTNFVFGDKLAGIIYIGGNTFNYSQTTSNYTMCRLYDVNHVGFQNVNKMLYIPNATSLTYPSQGDSCFGNEKWQPNTPYKIVYLKGVSGQQTTIADKMFNNCTITNLIINNTTLPEVKNAMLTATNVYLPDSILTSTTVNNVTTYSIDTSISGMTNPWSGQSSTIKPISEFPTVATLTAWEDEQMPVKLVEELM